MTRPSWIVTNFFVFFLFFLIAASAQASLFHWMLGYRANIQIALVMITYICLYRDPLEAFLFTCLGCYCLGLMSSMYASTAVFGGVCLFFALRTLRKQVYSSNPVFFTWTALSAILGFHVLTWLTSVLFDSRHLKTNPIDWILEIFITSLFAKSLYLFFIFIDKKTKRYTVTELNS